MGASSREGRVIKITFSKGGEEMKIAVCAQAEGIQAAVEMRFGRAAYFVIVDTETQEVESYANPNTGLSGGAGPQTVQFLSGLGVEAVVVGNVGPNAMAALKASGIKAYTGLVGTVEETVQRFQEGKLQPVSDSTVASHFGLGQGGGRGGGRGTGRGGGRGRFS
jgi:predicted Fe-Mo cluster-binding NifX family protein